MLILVINTKEKKLNNTFNPFELRQSVLTAILKINRFDYRSESLFAYVADVKNGFGLLRVLNSVVGMLYQA